MLLGTNDREQPAFCRILFVKKQILSNPKRRVDPNHHNANNERHQHVVPNVSGHKHHNRHKREGAENCCIVKNGAEYRERSVTREVEEVPGDKEEEKDDHGEWVP
ncbi:uncharacterized protein DS421_19g655700 [Arachis hypogaea]|uniref:Uncharacterized protein n=1 Tax=Arachis hypogaea TaxID=3818 RepID=A0A6B9V9S7_ARAHY|nr:uncharacterized protein DS421_19g655700 [Arachis hypogaea]